MPTRSGGHIRHRALHLKARSVVAPDPDIAIRAAQAHHRAALQGEGAASAGAGAAVAGDGSLQVELGLQPATQVFGTLHPQAALAVEARQLLGGAPRRAAAAALVDEVDGGVQHAEQRDV